MSMRVSKHHGDQQLCTCLGCKDMAWRRSDQQHGDKMFAEHRSCVPAVHRASGAGWGTHAFPSVGSGPSKEASYEHVGSRQGRIHNACACLVQRYVLHALFLVSPDSGTMAGPLTAATSGAALLIVDCQQVGQTLRFSAGGPGRQTILHALLLFSRQTLGSVTAWHLALSVLSILQGGMLLQE